MKKCKLVLFAWMVLFFGCTVQPAPIRIQPPPLTTPMVRHQPALGCEPAHDTVFLPGVYIDAFPSLPPKADPNYVVLHFSDGTTLWEKPHYGRQDCSDYLSCRYATLIRNPVWNECSAKGISYEAAAADGRPLLDSSFWVFTEPTTNASAYVGFACGQGYAGPNFTAASNKTAEKDCLQQASAAAPTGTNVAAGIALGTAYFKYRAAYDRPVYCSTDGLNGSTPTIKCY
jgi:hypothetical protein